MNKKTIIIVVILLVAVLFSAGYFFWARSKKISVLRFLQKNSPANDRALDDATRGVLPDLETDVLKNKPDINPADNANPIKDIKINPFD